MELEWVLDSSGLKVNDEEKEAQTQATDLIPPPQDTLEILYELAVYGSMEDLHGCWQPYTMKLSNEANGWNWPNMEQNSLKITALIRTAGCISWWTGKGS